PVKFIPGNGDGTFDPPIDAGPYPTYLSDLTAGDVNADSHLDLIYTHSGNPGSVAFWLGNGTGQFSLGSTLTAGNDPTETILADVDGDGCTDLVTVNSDSRNVSIFRGHCNGAFDPSIFVPVSTYPKTVICADLDGDPYPDLATAPSGANTI